MLPEAVEDRQRERRGLAGAGLGRGEDVASLEHEGDRLGLDGGGLLVALLLDGPEEVGRQAEGIEGHLAPGARRAHRRAGHRVRYSARLPRTPCKRRGASAVAGRIADRRGLGAGARGFPLAAGLPARLRTGSRGTPSPPERGNPSLRPIAAGAIGGGASCVSLAYFGSAPRLQPPDRQASTEDRRPPRQDPVVTGGRARPHLPVRPAYRSAHPVAPIPRVRARYACPRAPSCSSGGTDHRRRAPCTVFRRRGGKSVAGIPRRRPAGVRPPHRSGWPPWPPSPPCWPWAASRRIRRSPRRPAGRSSSSSGRSVRRRPTTSQTPSASPRRPARTARPSTRSTARTRPGPESGPSSQGANLFIYLGHGNGWPSPYGPFERYTKDGLGPECERRQLTRQVLRRVLRRPVPELRAELGRDPEPALLRVRQQRVGQRLPDEGDRDQAGRQLRRRLPPDGRPGGLRRGHRQRRPTSCRACSSRRRRSSRSSSRIPPATCAGTSASTRRGRPARSACSIRRTTRTTTTGR